MTLSRRPTLRARSQTIMHCNSPFYVLSLGEMHTRPATYEWLRHMQSDSVRTVLYVPHLRVHKTDEALVCSAYDCPHRACTEFTKVRRLVALAPPSAAIDERSTRKPSATTNAS